MGITTDEFIERMYAHSSSGDWSEFGEDAQKLKWVNHIVDGIEALGIAAIDVSPAYWRTLGNRLAARLALPEYTAERHAAWLAGKVLP